MEHVKHRSQRNRAIRIAAKRMKRRQHSCGACPASIEHWMRLCNRCWHRLPGDQRRAIAAAREAGNQLQVAELTRAAAAWLTDHSPAAVAARQLGEMPP